MDAQTQELIDYYLPHQPDPSLQLQEFYYLQYTAGTPRVIRVYALDILPCKDGYEYGIYQMRGGQLHWVDVGYESMVRGCRMGDLYDNKQDCKDQTHCGIDWWEEMRKAQREEAIQ